MHVGFITGSSYNLWTLYFQSLPTTIYVRWDPMVSCILSSNITIGISLSIVLTMSWNSSITTVMGRYHLLVWSGLECVLMSKAGVWISIRLRKQQNVGCMCSVKSLNRRLQVVSVNSLPIESYTNWFVIFYCTNSYNDLIEQIPVAISYYKLY